MFNTRQRVRDRVEARKSELFTPSTGRRVVALEGVTKVYDTGAGDFSTLSRADLAIDSGELVAIVGKSGSGKSTLLNMSSGKIGACRGVV